MRLRFVIIFLAGLWSAGSWAQESKVELKPGTGRDKVGLCLACHSLDYIEMNSRFLDRAGWLAEVNKMANAFKAPIQREDIDVIVAYLSENYGKRPER